MKLSIQHKLLAAFSFNLLLIVLLGAFALAQMRSMSELASLVADETIPSMHHVDRIDDLVARYRSLQLEFLIQNNAADGARIESSINEVEAAMDRSLLVLQLWIRSPKEQVVYRSVEDSWQRLRQATHSRFLPMARRGNTGSVQPVFSRLNPLHNDLAEAAAVLAQLNELQATESMAMVQAGHVNSRRLILVETVLSGLMVALVGFLLASTVVRRLRRLNIAARHVAAGDLQQRVAMRGFDEVRTLAESFNHMVACLQSQHEDLEDRNAELRLSLERQRALTEALMEREAGEQAAQRAQAEAEAASSAKSLFLATMSHELRTPLNAILGYAQMMKLEAERAGGENAATSDVERILTAGRHLMTVINNVLDFSKIEQGQVDLDLLDIPVFQLLEEVVGIVEPLATEQNNELLLACGDLGSFHSDPVKVRQILFNLLSNAVKFTRNGQVRLSARRHLDDHGEWLLLKVSDTGIGIAVEQIERIFQPFRQAQASVTRRFGGTGLGLVVSRQLSELLGGSLKVDSELGQGSTFTVRLPIESHQPLARAASGELATLSAAHLSVPGDGGHSSMEPPRMAAG